MNVDSLVVRVHSLGILGLAMATFCGEVKAQAARFKLARLRGEAAAAFRDMNGIATCEKLHPLRHGLW
jgi:hypothetical protein